jgi:hypothetical protein
MDGLWRASGVGTANMHWIGAAMQVRAPSHTIAPAARR